MMQIINLGIAFISLYIILIWINILFLKEVKKVKNHFPTVSIAIPVYNEEKTIKSTLSSIINLDYPKKKLEIIIVNDGSRDSSEKVINRFIAKHEDFNFIVINKENEGKSAALNKALEIAKGELFSCVDADSLVTRDSLKKLVQSFDNKKVGAVISSIKVHNPKNVYEKMQKIEYIMSVFLRKLMTKIGTLLITHGVLSVYRTNVIRKLGGFDTKILTEDLEIAMRLKSKGYIIKSELDSITYTKVPNNFMRLWDQRIRWARGFIESHIKYKNLLFDKKYGRIAYFQYPLNILTVVMLLIVVFIAGYNISTSLYEFIVRNILIKGYFLKIFQTAPLRDVLLGQNIKLLLPIVLSSILLIFFVIYAFRYGKEKLESPFYLLAYFLAYPYLISLHWCTAFTKQVLKMRKKW